MVIASPRLAGTHYITGVRIHHDDEEQHRRDIAEKVNQLVAVQNRTATAAPTTGTWTAGTIVYNSAPSVGSPVAWSCTVSGTPGTWVAWANL